MDWDPPLPDSADTDYFITAKRSAGRHCSVQCSLKTADFCTFSSSSKPVTTSHILRRDQGAHRSGGPCAAWPVATSSASFQMVLHPAFLWPSFGPCASHAYHDPGPWHVLPLGLPKKLPLYAGNLGGKTTESASTNMKPSFYTETESCEWDANHSDKIFIRTNLVKSFILFIMTYLGVYCFRIKS